jgi:hypothetical protein
MRKLMLIGVILACTPFAIAQDCSFAIADDDSLETALTEFHDIMAELWHGPVAEDNMFPVRKMAHDLSVARDAVMAANLPEKFFDHCADISAVAEAFSSSVSRVVELVDNKGDDDEIKTAFSEMHDAYRSLRHALVLPEEMIDAFHDVLQPLWHESYRAKDTAAIVKDIPKLKVRAKLLHNIAGRTGDVHLTEACGDLLETISILEEAAAAEDDIAILAALEAVHTAFHALHNE